MRPPKHAARRRHPSLPARDDSRVDLWPADGAGRRGPKTVARVAASLARHAKLATSVAFVVAGSVAYGIVNDLPLSLPYGVIVVGGALLAAALEPEEGFSPLVLVGLSLWAVGHLAGGTIGLDGDRTLYNAVIPGGIHFDNVVHLVGFGTAGLAWWEASRPWLRAAPGHRLAVAVAVWLAGMGVGALNEVVEFIATVVLPETNVGGYRNTGRDLIANLLGAAVAGIVAARREGVAGTGVSLPR